jgi:hypothetical protein
VRAAWWQEKQDGVVDKIRCRVAAHDRNLHAGFAAVHDSTVGLLGRDTKSRPKARQAETGFGHTNKLRRGGHASGRKVCVEAKRGAVVGHPSDSATKRIPKVPLEGVYPSIM